MASGTIPGSNNGQCQCKISWSSSAGTGGSTVNANLIAQNINDYYFQASVYYGYSVSIDGNSKSGSGGRLSGSTNGSVTLLSHSKWVSYTGNKSITISGSINLTGILNGGTISASKSVALDKVGSSPSTPTITAPSSSTISETSTSISVTWNAATSYSGTGNYILQVSQNGGAWSNVSTSIRWSTRSYSYSIPNKAQGTKYQFRVAAKNDVGTSGYSTSGTVTLNKLNAPTIGTINTYNPYVTTVLTVPLSGGSQTNGSSSFTRRADLYYGDTWLAGCATPSNGNTSVSITYSAANYLSKLGTKAYSSNSFKITAWIQNSNGSRSGYVSKNFTVNINSDGGATPTLGAPTFSGGAFDNPSTCFITGVSNLNVSSPAATLRRAPSGTTISYSISCTGTSSKSGQTANFGSLSAGTKTITVTATDSRGLSTSVSKQCVFQGYAAPTISNFSGSRLEDPNTSAKITYTVSYTPIYQYTSPTVKGNQLNSITVQQYSLNGTAWNDCTSGITIANLSTEQVYNIQLRVADNVRTTTYTPATTIIPTIKTLFGMRQWGIGINRVPSNGFSLDINGKTRSSDAFIATTADKTGSNDGKTGVIVSGYGLMGLVATSPYINFHQGNATDYTHRIVAADSGFNFYSNTGVHWYTGNNAKHAWIDSAGNMSVQGNITSTSIIKAGNVGIYGGTIDGANNATMWVKLGTLSGTGDSQNTVIDVYTGNGYNAMSEQNGWATIMIKDGWQSASSTTSAFGVTVEKHGYYMGGFKAKVIASAYNKCDVWVYMPWRYWNGNYVVKTTSSWTHANVKQASEPSGVAQAITHFEMFPVGAVYITVTNTNPGTFLPGTWVQFGQGRTLIGAGTGNDGSTSMSFTSLATGGEYKHTLTNAEMPKHNHGFKSGSHTWLWGKKVTNNVYLSNALATSGNPPGNNAMTSQNIWNATNTNGSGGSHNNLSPYIVVYFWRRTA